MNEKYNGWANFETWLTALWLSEWHLTYADFLTDQELDSAAKFDFDKVCYRLSECLRDQVEEFSEQENACTGLFADLLNSALSRVDWYDIAYNWLSNAVQEVENNAV